jgi:uncharacterized protein
MFPLGSVLFPYAQIPLHVFEERYRALTRDCLAADSRLGIVLITRGAEVGGGDQRTDIGTRVVITKSVELTDGRWLLMVEGEARIRICEWLPDDPYPQALVVEHSTPASLLSGSLLERAEQCVRRTRGLLSESGTSSALSADVIFDVDPQVAVWQLCAEAPVSAFDAHRLLATDDIAARLELLIELTESMALDLHRMMAGE